MPTFEATVILEVKVSAPNEAAARAYIKEELKICSPDAPPDIRLRLLRTPDGRLIAVRPNLPQPQVVSQMVAWPSAKVILYGTCAKPRTRHQLCQAVHERLPLIDEHTIAVLIRELTVDGWIKPYMHNVDIDPIPSEAARAQILALAGN